MIKTIFSVLLLLYLGSAASDETQSTVLPNAFFTPSVGVEKIYAVGTVKHIGISEYEKLECPKNKVCLHLAAWHIYELDGYILPNNEETETIRVAHRYGSPLTTEVPWLATLEKITDQELRKNIGADYLLVGVELGRNVFCPSKNSVKLFKNWQSDVVVKKANQQCFSL